MSAVLNGVDPDRAQDFARLLEITQLLRQEFESDQWSGAAELEAKRRAILERVFDEHPTAAELPSLTAALREVVRLNHELIGLAEHRRRALGRALDTNALGARAGRIYRSASAPVPGRRP